MKVSKEMLMAYVDGELDAAAVETVEQAMRDDPDTASAVASARALRDRIRQAYAPVLDEPVPARLLAAANGSSNAEPADTGNVVPLRPARAAHAATGRSWRWPQWTALAASLVLGVLAAPLLDPDRSPMLETSDGALVAGGELARTLDTRLTADGPAGDVAVGLSFRGKDGRYCRTFTLAPPQSMAGLACRDGDAWRVSALGEATSDGGELRRASTALPPAILAEIDARLQGDPLDTDGERKARDAGWR